MSGKAHILVVDDEATERQTLAEILRLEGYHVSTVGSGEAAVDFVRTNVVDLMVLDLRMGGMSGLEVVKVINQIAPDVEIILLTAYGSMESALEALRQRVHDYLLKPSSPTQILESVARGLMRRAARLQAHKAVEAVDKLEPEMLDLGEGVVFDVRRRAVRWEGGEILLTPAEGRLLKILAESPGQVFSHRELVLLVQGYSLSQQEAPEILRPLISRLRLKLAAVPYLPDHIVSVRGTGYLYDKGQEAKSVSKRSSRR